MNLTRLSQFFKKYSWIIISSTLILIFAALLLIRANPPKPPAKNISEDLSLKGSNIKTSAYDFSQTVFPTENPATLPVFRSSPGNLLTLSDIIAQNLEFSQPPTNLNDLDHGTGIAYSKEVASLTVYDEEIAYHRFVENPVSGTFRDQAELESTAENFLLNFNLPKEITYGVDFSYFILFDENLVKTQNPQEANIARLTFSPKISGVEIVSSGEIAVSINKNNEILSVIYKSPKVGEIVGDYKLISPQDAIGALIQGGGSLIRVVPEADYVPVPQNFDAVKIKRAYPAYYFPPKSQDYIQPVWVFEGEKLTERGYILLLYAVPAIIT